MRQKLVYQIDESDLVRFRKTYIGFVEKSIMSYNMQEIFNIEGYFAIQVTPLGTNICLLKDRVEGELHTLMVDGKNWLTQWFSEVHPWKPKYVNDARVT